MVKNNVKAVENIFFGISDFDTAITCIWSRRRLQKSRRNTLWCAWGRKCWRFGNLFSSAGGEAAYSRRGSSREVIHRTLSKKTAVKIEGKVLNTRKFMILKPPVNRPRDGLLVIRMNSSWNPDWNTRKYMPGPTLQELVSRHHIANCLAVTRSRRN